MLEDEDRLRESAAQLAAAVRARYTPAQIYGSILERIGVAAAKPVAAA
jgi:hypothetical protein